jgi:hypothetical protein
MAGAGLCLILLREGTPRKDETKAAPQTQNPTSATTFPTPEVENEKATVKSHAIAKENSHPTDEQWLAAGIDPKKIEKPARRVRLMIESIALALRDYREEYGSFPPGESSKEIADALFGKNPKKLAFLDNPRKRFTNSQGELIDPWGTPYHLIFTEDNFEIKSAGADKRFGTGDDEVFPKIK